MTIQFLLVTCAAGLATLYFLRGAVLEFRGNPHADRATCGKCAAGGCPAAQANADPAFLGSGSKGSDHGNTRIY